MQAHALLFRQELHGVMPHTCAGGRCDLRIRVVGHQHPILIVIISRSRTRRGWFPFHPSSTRRRTARLPNHPSSRLAAHLHLASCTARCSHASRWPARTAKNETSRMRGGRTLKAVGSPLAGALCEPLEQEGYGRLNMRWDDRRDDGNMERSMSERTKRQDDR